MVRVVLQTAVNFENTEGTKVRGSESLLWAATALKGPQHSFKTTGQECASLS